MASCNCRNLPVVIGDNWEWVIWGREPECILDTGQFLMKDWNFGRLKITKNRKRLYFRIKEFITLCPNTPFDYGARRLVTITFVQQRNQRVKKKKLCHVSDSKPNYGDRQWQFHSSMFWNTIFTCSTYMARQQTDSAARPHDERKKKLMERQWVDAYRDGFRLGAKDAQIIV